MKIKVIIDYEITKNFNFKKLMRTPKISPQTFFFLLVGLIFIPRLFSEVVYQTGTVLILTFWTAPFVLIDELANKSWRTKVKLSKLPKLTSLIFVISLTSICFSFYWRDLIYVIEPNRFQNLKRILYALNPIILFSWFPFIQTSKKYNFIRVSLILTLGLFSCLTIPKLLDFFSISSYLNYSTAYISGLILKPFVTQLIQINEAFIVIGDRSIEVKEGCSSIPQIMILLSSFITLYVCCKIKSNKSTLVFLSISIFTAFISNAIRISLLTQMVLNDKDKLFDFWHDGAGSLIYSFIVMLLNCSIYYYIWAKENPVNNEN